MNHVLSSSAQLCESQKEKLALKNKGKESLLGPRPDIPEQSYDHIMEEFDQFVAFKAFQSWKGKKLTHIDMMKHGKSIHTQVKSSQNLGNNCIFFP